MLFMGEIFSLVFFFLPSIFLSALGAESESSQTRGPSELGAGAVNSSGMGPVS